MSDPTPLPPPPPALPPYPPSPAPAAVGSGTLVVGVISLLAGLCCLVPGSLCSVMGLAMQFDRQQESSQIGGVFLVLGVPLLLIGIFLVRFAWRRLRGPKVPAPAR